MPDLNMSLRTLPGIVPLPKLKMVAIKPEVEITFERREMAPRFQLLSLIFDLARLEYDIVDIVRLCLTLPDVGQLPTIMMADTETGNGNSN